MTGKNTHEVKEALEVVSAINRKKGDMSLRAFAEDIKFNRGYLSAVINGKRPASRKLRSALGLCGKRRKYDLTEREAREIGARIYIAI